MFRSKINVCLGNKGISVQEINRSTLFRQIEINLNENKKLIIYFPIPII